MTTLTYVEAAQIALPGLEPTSTACHVDPAVEPDVVAEAIKRLDERSGCMNWWVGDLNVEVLIRKRNGEADWLRVHQSLDQPMTARAVRLALVFPPERRRASLSWSHHDLVAAMGDDDQDRLLDLAEREGLTRDALKAIIAQEREDAEPRLDPAMSLRPWKPPTGVAMRVAELAANGAHRVVVDLDAGTVEQVA